MTKRICFQLRVRPDMIDEYKQRHAEVWPEMREALTRTGWRNYSLFLTADGTLIGYLECDDFDAAQAAMAATDVNARWQQDMASYFISPDGDLPDESIDPIPEIFHLP